MTYEVYSTGSRWGYKIGDKKVEGFPTRDDAIDAAEKAVQGDKRVEWFPTRDDAIDATEKVVQAEKRTKAIIVRREEPEA